MSKPIDYFSQGKNGIFLPKERDFGEVLNDTITILKLLGRPFYRVILFTVVPISLVNGIFLGLFMDDANSIVGAMLEHPNTMESPLEMLFTWKYFGALAIGLLESLVITAVVYSFLKLYSKGDENLGVNYVWAEARRHLLNILVGTILLVVIIVLLFGIAGGIIGGTVAAFGPGGGIFIAFILIFLIILGAIYISLAFSMMLPSIVFEDIWAIKAIRRSTKLVSQNWGQTFLVLIVAYISIGLMSSVFNIPAMILQWATALNSLEMTEEGGYAGDTFGLMSLWTVLGACIAAIGSALVTPIIHVVVGIQYFNLRERLEGLGIKALIDSFGKKDESWDDEEEEW